MDFDKELKRVSKKISKTTQLIRQLGSGSNQSAGKLKKKRAKLKLLRKNIISCRNGSFTPETGADCSDPATLNGSDCDDGNPCTSDDRCSAGVCSGSLVPMSILTCGSGECAISTDQCASGVFTACYSGSVGDEICNQIDDNCDGQKDEGITCVSPSPTPSVSPTQSPSPTSTPTPTTTPTPIPTPQPGCSPVPVVCESVPPLTNSRPNGCSCTVNGDCDGDCSAGMCVNGSTAPICAPPGNLGNLSAKCCPCNVNGDCTGDCVGGFCT